MPSIKGRYGEKGKLRTYKLSNGVFVVKSLGGWHAVGTRVRLISGLKSIEHPRGGTSVGYHFTPGWVTVCREDRAEAEWRGQPIDSIEPAEDQNGRNHD